MGFRAMKTAAPAAALLLILMVPAHAEPTAPDLPPQTATAEDQARRSAETIAAERAVAAARDKGEDDTMHDDHPLIRSLVAANPGQDLVICIAGCEDHPKIVQMRAHVGEPAADPAALPASAMDDKSKAVDDNPAVGAVPTISKPVASAQK